MRKVLYILGELEDSDLQWIYDAGNARSLSPGSELIREGVHQESLYIVVDGELAVRKGDVELARLGAGEVVGDMSLLDKRPPSATVVPLGDAVVFEIPHSKLNSKLRSDPHFGTRFYRALCIFLANRLSRTDAMIGSGGRVSQETDELDEISPDALGNVSLAGARFDWFLQQVMGR